MSNESEITWLGPMYRSLKWLRYLIVGAYVIAAVVVVVLVMFPTMSRPGGSARLFIPVAVAASLGVPLNFLLLWIVKMATSVRVGYDAAGIVIDRGGKLERYPFSGLTQVYTRHVEEKQAQGSVITWFPWSRKGEKYQLLIAKGPGVRVKLRWDEPFSATSIVSAAQAANPQIEEPIELA